MSSAEVSDQGRPVVLPFSTIWGTLRKISDLLEPGDRWRAGLLLSVILIMGLMEVVGVVSIMPFVAVLSDPNIVETNDYLSAIYGWTGFESRRSFLLLLGFVVLVLTVGSTAFKAFATWAVLNFSMMRSHSLSLRLFRGYLYRPYPWFLRRHSADLGKAILSEVRQVINGTLMPALHLIAQGVIVLLLISLLIVVDPLLAIIVSAVLGGAYGLVFWTTRKYLSRIGADRVRANKERFRISNEALGGIKDVKIHGLENRYLDRFQDPSRRFVKHQVTHQLITQLPQYALQVFAIAGVLLIVQYQTFMMGGVGKALPLIALYVLAGYRLLPAIHRAYQAVVSLRFARPAFETLHRDLVETAMGASISSSTAHFPGDAITLQRQLELREISYTYPGTVTPTLENVSLTIPAGSLVGIVGRTGAGKTTLADVILGLLDAESGHLVVDGIEITEKNRRAWQSRLGYVPQHIFLIDDSVAANIAFGVPKADIDLAAVERAARVANLHTFVSHELKKGYRTVIGERGARLSGGQRQRVGIARALYHDPDMLIMDEATSALDNITERAVMDAATTLAGQKTILLIAHRLTTVRRCDVILLFEHGQVIAQGTYDELVGSSQPFRAMVSATQD